MKTEKKILKLFIGDKKPRTIREISKEISADYRITHTAVKRLISKKIILADKVGKSLSCELNPNSYGIEIYEAENERKENLLKNKDIKQLFREVISKIKPSFFIFLIFGSYAKNKQAKSSDIDMIFISNDKNLEEKILSVLSLIPIKTHALVFTEEDFIRMKDSKKPNVVKEAIENNIILYGAENYYKLKNA